MLHYVRGNMKNFDILNDYKPKEIVKLIDAKNMDLINELNGILLVELSGLHDLTDRQIRNLADYLDKIPKDLCYGFMKNFSTKDLLFDKIVKREEFIDLRRKLAE